MTRRSIVDWVMSLERSFAEMIVTVPFVVVAIVPACFALLVSSFEDRRPDIARALGIPDAEQLESPTVNAAFKARFPDGTPATSLDRLVADLHGICRDTTESPTTACANDAADPACRPIHVVVHACVLPVTSTICWRRDLRASARREDDGTLTRVEASVEVRAC